MAFVSATAIICQNALIERDNVTSLIRLSDIFLLEEKVPEGSNPPIQLVLWVQVRMTGDDEDKHSLHVDLLRPDGETMRNTIVEDMVFRHGQYPESGYKIVMAQGPIVVEKPVVGSYTFQVLLDGKEVAKTLFSVLARQGQKEKELPNSGSSPAQDTTVH